MRMNTSLALALGAASLAAFTVAGAQAPANTLVVAKAAAAPALDGNANDPAWAAAAPLTVKLSGGENFGGKGESTATLKAVTAGDMIYILLQYSDPTESKRRGPYVKQPDGSWTKLKDPRTRAATTTRITRTSGRSSGTSTTRSPGSTRTGARCSATSARASPSATSTPRRKASTATCGT
jgi:hypothetical protein